MKKLPIALVVYSQILCFQALAIVGGSEISEDEFESSPIFQASVAIHAAGHVCSGALVAPSIILTAAHCVYGFENPRAVRVAIRSIDERRGTFGRPGYRGAKKVILHPSFEKAGIISATNDIALIVIEEVSSFPKASVVDNSSLLLRDYSGLLALGYGRSNGENDAVDSGAGPLRYTTFLTSEIQEPADSTDIGLILIDGKRTSTCKGDSGGPLYGIAADGTSTLIGISHTVRPILPEVLNREYDDLVGTGKQTEADFIADHPGLNMCNGIATFVDLRSQTDWIKAEIQANSI